MYSSTLQIVIGLLATVTISVVLATSDPGYSKYYRLYNSREQGYSNYGSASLTQQNHQDPHYRSVGEAYKSLPSRRVKGYQRAHSSYAGFQNHPSYYSEHPHPKYSRGGSKPHRYGHHAKYNSHRHPGNVPNPYPMPHPKPHPISRPEPHPITHPHPHPIPNPHPYPILHPKPIPHPHPEPVPHPIPHPNPLPVPIPFPQPIPGLAPTPFPQPQPLPIPEEVPDIFIPDVDIEEDISIPFPPVIVQPLPIVDRPDIELSQGVILPSRPIETIGRPPVAPSVRPPNVFNLQRAVPGFVDIQRVNIRPLGEPAKVIPQQQFNAIQFSPPTAIVDPRPNLVQTNRDPNAPIETLFPVNEVNFGGISSALNTPIETLFPVGEIVPADTTRTRQPIFEPERLDVQPIPFRNAVKTQRNPVQNERRFQQIPAQNVLNIPLLAKAVPAVVPADTRARQPIFEPERLNAQPIPFRNVVKTQRNPVQNERRFPQIPAPNVLNIPLLANAVPAVVPVDTTRTRQPIFEPERQDVQPIRFRNVIQTQQIPVQNERRFQQIPNPLQNLFKAEFAAQNVLNIPLLAKAVPAVPVAPESNPQPLFKNGNVSTATATATALLLKASQADFATFRAPTPLETSNRRPPLQPLPSIAPQIDFRRLPSVVLPDPVPAVPLTQP